MGGLEVTIAALSAFGTLVQAVCETKDSFWDPKHKAGLEGWFSDLKKGLGNLNYKKSDFQDEDDFESYAKWSHKLREIELEMYILLNNQYGYAKDYRRNSNFQEGLSKLRKKVSKVLLYGKQMEESMFQPAELYIKRAWDITNYTALREPFQKILGWLKSEDVNGIRIHGAVGMGKTNIMLNLMNHAEVVGKFDPIIWIDVPMEGMTGNLSMKQMQIALLEKLRLKVGDNSDSMKVAERVSRALRGKAYLLLLDNVTEDFELEHIGIPKIGKSGSKVVLTTKYRHACSSFVNEAVKVNSLKEEDAWKMFRDVLAYQKLDSEPNAKIKRLARRVCKECYGVPLYIEKVASTFKLKANEHLWKRGLNSWRTWPEKECKGIREVYNTMKFCYDQLDGEHQQKCFLYGVLYPEGSDIEINRLLECWEAQNLVNSDIKKAYDDAGHHVLTHLTNVSLLEEDKIHNHVVMHGFIRQMALFVVESDPPPCKYLVKTSRRLSEPPASLPWNEMTGISFGDNMLAQLPDSPNCSTLTALFVNKNMSLKSIPPSFFDHMGELQVLDASHTGIVSLPTSTSKLIKLKVLYLNNCTYLEELPSDIIKLAQLEALDIRRCKFSNMPPQIDQLTRLRRLQVSFAQSKIGNPIQLAPPDYSVVSKLCALEEFVVDVVSPEKLSVEARENIIKEVATLENLRTLKFCIDNAIVNVIEVVGELLLHISKSEATILQTFIEKRLWTEDYDLTPFRVLIGCQETKISLLPGKQDDESERYIKYRKGTGSSFPVAKILAVADAFELLEHKDIIQLSDFGTMNSVKYCIVEDCEVLETIAGTAAEIMLPILEDLNLKNLPKFKGICRDPLQPGSFGNLQTLVLISCLELKQVFPPGSIRQLCEIQHLEIELCSKIVEVIAESEAVHNAHLLPKLKKLIVRKMPNLTSICKIDNLEWPSLEELEIKTCDNLSNFALNKKNAEKLRVIRAEKDYWDGINFPNEEVKERLQQIFEPSGDL